MKQFGGSILFLDRSDINTDEIIPAKYLSENSKQALKPYMLEDLKLDGFNPQSETAKNAKVIVTRGNFACGSSREHAVWVFGVNGINVVIAESFARIFRQNMFNCGMLAIELSKEDIDTIFTLQKNLRDINPQEYVIAEVDFESFVVNIKISTETTTSHKFQFQLNDFERDLIKAGGWLAYADKKY
ncbi:3-isopropylmalate dehydratase small subunit [Candidatus Parcubacteria bacterium]|nr:3-isopropylmalate dehydratase small subunit [Candidatus Parcubacteria bacterium]